MPDIATSLRERQAHHVRTSVLDAVIASLETTDIDNLSMADIASAAGVSLRTLYRHYADRDSLLHAAGEHLYASLGVPVAIANAKDIAANFREAARRLASRPKLARALVKTRAGRLARSGIRKQRVEAIRAAFGPLANSMDPGLARRAAAVIAHLCSAAAWVEVADDSGLPDAEAQEAVGWAIETIVEALPHGNRRKPGRGKFKAQPAKGGNR